MGGRQEKVFDEPSRSCLPAPAGLHADHRNRSQVDRMQLVKAKGVRGCLETGSYFWFVLRLRSIRDGDDDDTTGGLDEQLMRWYLMTVGCLFLLLVLR